MPLLSRAPRHIVDFVNEVKSRVRPVLDEAGITIAVFVATSTPAESDYDIPCLKLRGYPCAATIEKTSAKARLRGQADVILTINGERWKKAGDTEKTSTIHHELLHVEPVFGKDGKPVLDKADRPTITLRLHDEQIGVFREIVETYGVGSIDGRNVRGLFETYRQMSFDWGDDQVPQDAAPDIAGVIKAAG